MAKIILQRLVEEAGPGSLSANWTGFNWGSFSSGKQLYEYQQVALRNALTALWLYYRDPDRTVAERKAAFMQRYLDFGLNNCLDIPLDRSSAAKRRVAALLENYYIAQDDRLDYEQFINRMSFWMATGSGKTLVIVKLIELLRDLIRRGEIPAYDILVLAHRDELLEQLQKHVDDFNANGRLFIRLCELRQYAEVKRESPSLFQEQEVTIFYYRSDNLSDEQKEKIIDFGSYDNNGQWYILLDEAHKGDKEDSKRQHIYSILSRNGFLFNFSATFTDPRDVITTVANYNLSEFIRKGHGKHICILQQEARAFRRGDVYSDDEKQKIVLKALMMLSYVHRFEACVKTVQANLYHRPLMMTLVNSVNIEDADLKLFLRELVRIAKGKVRKEIWASALQELVDELRNRPDFLYETGASFDVDFDLFSGLTRKVLLQEVFNAPGPGEIEVFVSPSDRQEVAFKLKNSDDPFALVRIGNITDLLKNELSGYEINQHFNDEGFFERLNHPDSSINILLGSRTFYEGWDSNRPNVITYINIGTGLDARKFILQSMGRGVRIEPFQHRRKRLRELYAGDSLNEAEQAVFQQVKNLTQPLETVFVFGTNREVLKEVIATLDQESLQTGEQEIALEVNSAAVDGKCLLIPTYRQNDSPIFRHRELAKFALTPDNIELLQRYLSYLDDRVFLALHDTNPEQVTALRNALDHPEDAFRTDGRAYKNLSVLANQALRYFSLFGKEFDEFKELSDEIRHFRHIKVALEDISNLDQKIRRVIDASRARHQAAERLKARQISVEEFLAVTNNLSPNAIFQSPEVQLEICNIANHYYIPVLLSQQERVNYIRNIIHVRSEVDFVHMLEEYSKRDDNRLKAYDWWLFSRVDENLDDIAIPYYYPIENRIANFKPDFIFWLKKGNRYRIVFVDPKGTQHGDYQHKVDGYRALFEENEKPKVFSYQGMDVTVHLFLNTIDRQIVAEGYRRYWFDDMGQMMAQIE